jgi:dUTP pyrophosphatase
LNIKIKRFDKTFPLPSGEDKAACFDFICRETVTIEPHQIKPIAQNVAVQVPDGYALLIFARSSTAKRKGIMLANSVGVLDPFYCGDKDEALVLACNITDRSVTIEAGDKIAQGMIVKSEPIDWEEIDQFKERGVGGYQH